MKLRASLSYLMGAVTCHANGPPPISESTTLKPSVVTLLFFFEAFDFTVSSTSIVEWILFSRADSQSCHSPGLASFSLLRSMMRKCDVNIDKYPSACAARMNTPSCSDRSAKSEKKCRLKKYRMNTNEP